MSGPGNSKTSPFFSQSRSITTREPPKSLKQKLEKSDKKPIKRSKGASQDGQQPIQAAHSVASTFKKKDVNRPGDKSSDPEKPKWEPKDWRVVLEKLREMRASRPAPVDTMGCHKCADENASPAEKRFHILVALMLSSQTKDEVTFEAMKRLRDHGLTPDNIAKTEVEDLAEILKPVGFHKNKAKFLVKTCAILLAEYHGEIPNTIPELIKLPGVGPKMAHICMNAAWGIVTGIGVDTHVHRISNRLGWVPNTTKEPEKTRQELEKWLPREHWDEINVILVGFGQTKCLPIKPKCSTCSLTNLCPSCTL